MIQVAVVGARGVGVSHVAALRQLRGFGVATIEGSSPATASAPARRDVVFDVAGASASFYLTTSLTRAPGMMDCGGYHQGPRTVDMQAWSGNALDVVNGHVREQPRLIDSIRRGLDFVASGCGACARLVTHRCRPAETDKACAGTRAEPEGLVKAVIVP